MSVLCYGCFEKYDETLDICPHCGHEDGDVADEALHLAPGRFLKDTYIIGNVLGYGGFGVTYLGWNSVLEQKVAIKEYLPSEFSTRMPGQTHVTIFNGEKTEQFRDGVEKFVEEANRLAQFRNTDGIVRIYESFQENNTAYIIMEYLDGQTLTKYLEQTGQLTADESVRLLTPIIQSLQIVHKHGIIHRDIAPDNIMVTKDGQVKLIDFGAARYATTSRSRSLTVVIKPGYSPEEQYRSRGDQGPWTDVYAVGATMYRMITGLTPPDAMERRAFFESKKRDILTPVTKYSKKTNVNQETAILNAMNVRIEDRTPDMAAFARELNSKDAVKRRSGRIRKIDPLKWPRWMKIVMPVASCAVIALAVLFLTGVIPPQPPPPPPPPEGYTQVPSVIGDDIERAEQRTQSILTLQINGKRESDDMPANVVLTQDLLAGTEVRINTILGVVISAGKEEIIVEIDDDGKLPLADAQYRIKDEATAMLELQGMEVIITEEYSDAKAGVVISQTPAPTTMLEPGTTVILVVSIGSKPFEMPYVVGWTEVEAVTKLMGRDLVVESEYESNDVEPEGTVTGQSIPAGTLVKKGDAVIIYISSGIDIGEPPTTPPPEIASPPSPPSPPPPSTPPPSTPPPSSPQSTPPSTLPSTPPPTPTLTRIDVTPPSKTTYNIGESFSSSGMTVTAVYSDNTTKSVATSLCIITGFSSSTSGSKPITVSYTEDGTTSTLQFYITVNPKTLTRIDVKSPTKTTYDIGESFSSSGMTITAVYSDNTTKSVATSSCTITGFSSSTSGSKPITVSYTEGGTTRTTQFYITVNKKTLTRIDVKPPTKTTYDIGESLNTSGMTVTATYSDNTTRTVTSSCTTSGFSSSTSGSKPITVSYTEDGTTRTSTFTVIVNPNILTRIDVIPPSKTTYNIGESFSTSGMTVTATYKDNSTKNVTSSCTTNGFDSSSAGTKTITVSYSENGTTMSEQFSVTVQSPVWTDWTSSSVQPAGTTEKETRYRTRTREETTATTPSLSGWTPTGASNKTYGAWSAWTTTQITANDSLEVETQTRQDTVYKTVYNYYRYTYQYNGSTWWTYSSTPGQGTGIKLETIQTDNLGTYKATQNGYTAYTISGASGNWYQVDCGHKSAPGGSFQTQVPNGYVNITEYRSRTVTTTWVFWRWGAWSDWKSGTAPAATGTMEVEAQYRYR